MNDLAARLEKVTDLINQGFITPAQGRTLLNFDHPFYVIDNKLTYFHEEFIITVLEFE